MTDIAILAVYFGVLAVLVFTQSYVEANWDWPCEGFGVVVAWFMIILWPASVVVICIVLPFILVYKFGRWLGERTKK